MRVLAVLNVAGLMSELSQFVCVLAGECPFKCHSIKSLNGNRNALKKESSFAHLASSGP